MPIIRVAPPATTFAGDSRTSRAHVITVRYNGFPLRGWSASRIWLREAPVLLSGPVTNTAADDPSRKASPAAWRAADVARSEGWDAVTVGRLAERIDYSAIYPTVFQVRDDIASALVRDVFVRLSDAMDEAASGGPDTGSDSWASGSLAAGGTTRRLHLPQLWPG
jgi:hypothetical protein